MRECVELRGQSSVYIAGRVLLRPLEHERQGTAAGVSFVSAGIRRGKQKFVPFEMVQSSSHLTT